MPYNNYNMRFMLPGDRSQTPLVSVKLSSCVTVKCACGYDGYARQITGRTDFPLYTCPQCHRIVQTVYNHVGNGEVPR